jgi:hypothetical protein
MKKVFAFILLLAFIAVGEFIYQNTSTSPSLAANVADFRDGNIMSDYVMSNKNTMTEAQIQAFLKSKNPCNDGDWDKYAYYTNQGYQYNWRDGHFVCMADESFNGESAARIIWQAAQDYNINPQVLIVLLQKEQGLVTDTWPNWSHQYRSATGYGCPDTAACDSQYFGFKNQVRNAANFYRAHLDNNRNWNWGYDVGWNSILYSPNCSSRKSVYIENKATAALYIYTPYTPTQEVLNAGYGTTPGCSAYGNRNFWLYFTDWFGSTQYGLPSCDSAVANVACVWRFRDNNNNAEFLTASIEERDLIAYTSTEWSFVGLAFYAFDKPVADSIPVYRVYQPNLGRHFYTSNTSEKDSVLSQDQSNILEGVVFHVYPSTTSTSTAYPIYRSFNNSSGHFYTFNPSATNMDEGVRFATPSGVVSVPLPPSGSINVHRLIGANSTDHFYTASIAENDAAVKQSGYKYEAIAFYASDAVSTPIYRLYNRINGDHYYTKYEDEKTQLVNTPVWISEEIAFYIDEKTPPVYQYYNNVNGDHFYTSGVAEALSISNKYPWQYNRIAFGSDQDSDTSQPLYRLYSPIYGHFYTTNFSEILANVNISGWMFEGTAWRVNTVQTNTPIYRLFNPSTNMHLFTRSTEEKDYVSSKDSFIFEGIAFYASDAPTQTPVYRLYGTKHFYTTNLQEKINAVNSGRWLDEGVAWYI